MSPPKTLRRMATAALLSHTPDKRCRHVAFIYKGKKLLSVGVNSNKTHPLSKKKFSSSQCAELNACLRLGLKRRHLPDFGDLTMIVVRLGGDGELAMSKPCPFCQDLMRQCGFKRVYFSDTSGELQQLTEGYE